MQCINLLTHYYVMIEIHNLAFSYGKISVLRNITMRLEEGRIYGLLGENGVGKTTLLHLLCGLRPTKEGSILIDGRRPDRRQPSLLQNLYYLPDELEATSLNGIDYARAHGRFWPAFDMQKFININRAFENDANQRMDRMSTGQLKKVYIAFCLACNTKYLLMDEPTNGLDIPSKAQFRSAILHYTSDDSTIIITTHQVRDLENVVNPIIILDRQNVLLNASLDRIAQLLYFDYSGIPHPDALYSEILPTNSIQVYPNTKNIESKVNIEALFNTVHMHKELIKSLFNQQ